MKKSFTVLISIILGVSLLAGCGGTPAPSTTSTPSATTTPPADTATSSSKPDSTPTPIPMTTVTVTHDKFGGMSLSFPGDKKYTVAESADTLEVMAFMEVPEFKDYIRDHLKAHIIGDGFEVAMGFRDRSDSTPGTYQQFFDAQQERERFNQFTEIQIGNETGFVVNARGIACFVFPGMTETSTRTIAVFTDATKEKGSSLDKDTIPTILENPDIKALLDTLVLIGDVPGAGTDEPGDTTPAAETIEGGYITFTAKDGWYVDNSDGIEGEKVYYIGFHNSRMTTIRIRIDKFRPVEEIVSETARLINGQVIDDITINGVVYHVVKQSDTLFTLITEPPGNFTFDGKKSGAIIINLSCTVETAMPFLETITIHELNK